MKNLSKISAFAILISLIVFACKDNFSEQDLLAYQSKAISKKDSLNAVKQLAAMNEAGQLLSYTLQVLEDKVPVTGVSAIITNQTSTAGTLSATTDVNGFATFKNIQIGANTVVISKTGYLSATFIVDFGVPTEGTNYKLINNSSGSVTVVPIKRTASNQVPVFSSAGTATATIKGNVTIETDLTNTAPEIPQGLVIKANLASVANGFGGTAVSTSSGSTNQSTISTYYFNAGTIGSATVDNTTGAYSMAVPATTAGTTLSIIYPVISSNQKIAYNRKGGIAVPAKIDAAVPAVYGPTVGTYDNVPSLPDAFASVTPAAPPAPGAGLKFTFTPVARPLAGNGTNFNSTTNNSVLSYTFNGITSYYRFNGGSGYTTVPTVTITGSGAAGAAATAVVDASGKVSSINISNGGSGFTSIPTITITPPTGTSSPITATFSFVEFPTQWTVTPDNSANTTPYKVLPSVVNFLFSTTYGSPLASYNRNLTVTNSSRAVVGTSSALDWLTVAGGQVIFNDPTLTYTTASASQTAPTLYLAPSSNTAITVNVSVDGNVTSSTYGQITGLTSVNTGSGYDVAPTIAISSLTGVGTGAAVEITPYITQSNGVFSWNGESNVLSGGKGYQANANIYYSFYQGTAAGTAIQFSGSSSVTVKTGDVIYNDVVYGTGLKKMNIN